MDFSIAQQIASDFKILQHVFSGGVFAAIAGVSAAIVTGGAAYYVSREFFDFHRENIVIKSKCRDVELSGNQLSFNRIKDGINRAIYDESCQSLTSEEKHLLAEVAHRLDIGKPVKGDLFKVYKITESTNFLGSYNIQRELLGSPEDLKLASFLLTGTTTGLAALASGAITGHAFSPKPESLETTPTPIIESVEAPTPNPAFKTVNWQESIQPSTVQESGLKR